MKSLRLIAVLFCLLLPLSASAQRVKISEITHTGTTELESGDRLTVIIIGTSGCEATFEIVGSTRPVPMRETTQGRYEVTYTVPRGLQVKNGVILGHLARGNRQDAMEADRTVSIEVEDDDGSGTAEAVGDWRVRPAPDSTVETKQPRVSVRAPQEVDRDSLKLFVDGIDFTRQLEKRQRGVIWRPAYELDSGRHRVEVAGRDRNGNRVAYDWNFVIGQTTDQGNQSGQTIEPFPPAEETISNSRPLIGIDFKQSISNATLYVDGRDFTQSANRTQTSIAWQPTYDLSPGTHRVQARASGRNGRLMERQWTFTIDPSQAAGLTDISVSPTSVRRGQTVNVSFRGPAGGQAIFDIEGLRQGVALRESSKGFYTGSYTLNERAQGDYRVVARLTMPNRQSFSAYAPQRLTFEGNNLAVDNLRSGMQVPVNFNIQGSAQAGTTVTATVTYRKNDVLGALAGATQQFTATANVGANGRFDIPVEASRIPRGSSFNLRVSDTTNSPPVDISLKRQ